MIDQVEPYQILVLLAAVAYISFMLGRASVGGATDPVQQAHEAERLFGQLSADQQSDVDQLLSAGQTIEAIKLVREKTGAGLRDSKRAVDQRRSLVGA